MRPITLIPCVALCACNLVGDADLPDGGADAEIDATVTFDGNGDARDARIDAESDTLKDADHPAEAGPITLVTVEPNFVTDRVCDLDGDDLPDNAIADLGEPDATLLAAVLSSGIAGAAADGSGWVLHMPWVDDVVTPDDPLLTLTSFSGEDGRSCEGGTTEGNYCVQLEHLDGCGEPTSVSTEATIENGNLSATGWTAVFGTSRPLILRGATIEGTVEARGAEAELTLCGFAVASELGDSHARDDPDGISALEAFLAGGNAFGMPGFPGMAVDVDTDGDGLESFDLDGDFRIERCIDGDATVIEGNDCWRDDRIADGFSLTMKGRFVSAAFLGRVRDWDRRECGLVYQRLENCRDSVCFYVNRREICPSQRSVLDSLLACEQTRCREDCGDPPIRCRACAEAECAVELAACLEAPVCCPVPPETSAWDPS